MITAFTQQGSLSWNYSFPSASRRLQRQWGPSVCRAEQSSRRRDNVPAESQLDSLDALLGTPPPAPPPADAAAEPTAVEQQAEGWYWWDRPAGRQTNPLRKRGMEVRAARQPPAGCARCTPRCPLAAAVPCAHAALHLPLVCCDTLSHCLPACLQPGAGGAYLDSERLTRDPLQLAVGEVRCRPWLPHLAAHFLAWRGRMWDQSGSLAG